MMTLARSERMIYWACGFFLALFFMDVNAVLAQPVAATTFGDVLCNAKLAGTGYPRILNAVAYIMGGFVLARGFLLLKRHAESPGQSPVAAGVAHIVGAAFLFSLPAIAGIMQQTILGNGAGSGSWGLCSAGTVGAASGLDTMMANFVKNIHGPMATLLSMISVIVGLTFIVKGLLAGVKTGTDPRAASPKNIIVNLVFGAILISIGGVLPDILKTLFGAGDASNMNNFSILGWSGISSLGGDMTAANNAAKAILAFVQIVGMIAFLRGWLVVKAAVEGGGQATIPQGITFILGGAMAVNIDVMLDIFDNTFGTGIIN